MDTIKLEATQGMYKTAKEAREAGRIPMAYYGKGVENRGLSVDYQEFRRAYKKGGRSTIMYFTNEKGEELPVLVHDIQYDPVTDKMIHVDLKAIDLNKPIHTDIPLQFVGQAPAVKELAGIFVSNKDSVYVECLPHNLVHEIQVDVSSLVDFNASITVGDIKAPEGITILDAPEVNVATVSAPRKEEEEVPVAAAEGEEAEGAEEGEKKEEGAEGEEKQGEEKKEEGEAKAE